MANHELKILVCSANVGNAEPTLTSLATWIPPKGSAEAVSPLTDDARAQLAGVKFDLIVIGMQEATWKKGSKRLGSEDGDLDDDDEEEAMERYAAAKNGDADPAPPPMSLPKRKTSFMLEAPEAYDSTLLKNMIQTTLGDGYTQLDQKQRGQMRLQIWVRNALADKFTDLSIRCENTGIGGVMANKGGIVGTLTYEKTRITFLTAHLAAHEGPSYYAARCDNITEILRGAKTLDRHDVAITSHHMFVLGDLNFRTKFEGGEKEENLQRALELIEKKDWKKLYEYDELQNGIKNGDLLIDFETLPCTFSPTFKVKREPGFVYKNQRTPSYTDRILFKSADGLRGNFKPLAYEACPGFITSDHKPIRGAFAIVPNGSAGSEEKPLRNFKLTFREMSCTDLPAMDVDGFSDPYVMFVWDSVEMCPTTKTKRVGAMTKTKWPTTKYITRNLNPVWEDEVELFVNGAVGPEGLLFLTVMDYDFTSQDDLLSTLTLNVRELVRMSKDDKNSKKEIKLDRPLLKYGKQYGSIKLTIVVEQLDEFASVSAERSFKKKKKVTVQGAVKAVKSFMGLRQKE